MKKPQTQNEPPASILFCRQDLIEKLVLEHLRMFVRNGADHINFGCLISAPDQMEVTLKDAINELIRREKL